MSQISKVISPQARMREYLQLVATGPELSRSLSADQAKDGLTMILNGDVDEVRAGIFLIALRMKRETDEENSGALDALNGMLIRTDTSTSEVLSIADPFNGYLRGLSVTPFLPAVFASCGMPAYVHGVQSVGPKYGITSHMVLAAAGKSVNRSVSEVADALDHPDIGWGYLDQEQYIPKLHNLVPLRDTMVKRTCISTLEVILKPISGACQTHLMTGFVHKAYPPVYCALARQVGFDSAVIVRGVEGGCIPSLSQVSRYFGYRGEEKMQLYKLAPKELGIQQDRRMVPIEDHHTGRMQHTGYQCGDSLKPVVEDNLDRGLQALSNRPGPMRDSLIYGAAIGLKHTRICSSLAEGAEKARRIIKRGAALERFNAG